MTDDDERLFRGLDAALLKLDERQQHVIWLRYYKGLKLREIGEKYGVCVARVQGILIQAIRRLRHPEFLHIILRYREDLWPDPVELPDFGYIRAYQEAKREKELKRQQAVARHRQKLMARKEQLEEKLLDDPKLVTAAWMLTLARKYFWDLRNEHYWRSVHLRRMEQFVTRRYRFRHKFGVLVDGKRVSLNLTTIHHATA